MLRRLNIFIPFFLTDFRIIRKHPPGLSVASLVPWEGRIRRPDNINGTMRKRRTIGAGDAVMGTRRASRTGRSEVGGLRPTSGRRHRSEGHAAAAFRYVLKRRRPSAHFPGPAPTDSDSSPPLIKNAGRPDPPPCECVCVCVVRGRFIPRQGHQAPGPGN